ncbi:MAG: translation initiation factor IF-2 N-terminal domain-containing protein [Acidaminococcaceae bacterium]|nr:translation initiation factor IF-2 N-terminal domain-containing protein [Acidaminococcaceae bacterium]
MSSRVYELAKESGISSAELVDIIKKLQIKKSAVSSLSVKEETRVREYFREDKIQLCPDNIVCEMNEKKVNYSEAGKTTYYALKIAKILFGN